MDARWRHALLPERSPSVSGRIEEIEVLRAIAVLMVLFEHVPLNLIYWHSAWFDFNHDIFHGAAGVDMFFVISGFVIARTLLPSLAACTTGDRFFATTLTFWVHRFWRLQPAAWFWVGVPVLLGAWQGRSGAFHDLHANLASGIAALLPIANFRAAQQVILATNGESIDYGMNFTYWSLALEEQFYLLLPLLVFIFRDRLRWVMLGLVAYQFVLPGIPILGWTRPGPVATGVLIAIFSRDALYTLPEPRVLAQSRVLRACFLVFSLAAVGMVASSMARPTLRFGFSIGAVLCGMLVYVASFDRGYLMASSALRRGLAWVGTRSYAIYLCHIPCFAVVREMLFTPGGDYFQAHTNREAATLVCLAVALTFGIAELSYRFIETPARRYGRSITIRSPLPA